MAGRGGNLAVLIEGDDAMTILLKMAKKVLLLSLLLITASPIVSAQTTGVGTWPTQKPIRLIAVFLSLIHISEPTRPY